jgi:hypothetical protein
LGVEQVKIENRRTNGRIGREQHRKKGTTTKGKKAEPGTKGERRENEGRRRQKEEGRRKKAEGRKRHSLAPTTS